MNRKQREEAEAQAAAEVEAADAGLAFFKAYPEALAVEAWWEADRRYGQNNFFLLFAFYQAFRKAREQRDAFHRGE